MKKLLIHGNLTMPSCVGIFNLPPLLTCTPSPWCKEHCYALKGRFIWKSVRDAHLWRYEQSKKSSFVKKIADEITRSKVIKYIRIHISGDFYSKEYVNKWAKIAEKFPDIIFKTNTKRIDLLQYMKRVFPKNVAARESTDPTRKWMGVFPQAAIKGTFGSENFYTCKDQCEECGFYCWHHPEESVVGSQIR